MQMTHSAVAKWHIEHEAGEAIRRAGLNYDHPVRAILENSAVIAGLRQSVVRVPNESDELVTLDERIKEMRNDGRYSALFPRPEGTVAKSDMQRISENFQAIAAGKIAVE
jgi:cell division protein ZapA (FtsZ GTPase activity inhibitor)